MEWGRLIQVLRTCLGWSQGELAKAAGVSASAVAKQEQGVALPSKAVKERIEKALGIDERTTRELQGLFGAIRAMMLAPEPRSVAQGLEATEAAMARAVREAVRIALVSLRAMEEDGTEGAERRMPPLPMG